jgi:DNA primase
MSIKMKNLMLDQVDIRELFDEINIEYHEKGKNVSEGWIGVCCPFCSDTSYHLGVHIKNKTISCFRCGTTGTVIKFLIEVTGNFEKSINLLRTYIPKELKKEYKQERNTVQSVELPKFARYVPFKAHKEFLHSRGYNYRDLSDKYNMHYVSCVQDEPFQNRIILPVIRKYRLVSFTSIDITGTRKNKYKHLKDELSIIPIKNTLFGLEFTKNNPVIGVVEGVFDQFRIGDGSVATLGTNVTEEQKAIFRKFQKLVIVFDGDSAGRIGSEKLANDMAVFMDVEIIKLDSGDPDELDNDSIQFIKSRLGR